MLKTINVGTKVLDLDCFNTGEILEIVNTNGWDVVDVLWERPFHGKYITTELVEDLEIL